MRVNIRWAILSDIHGNIWALDAVYSDIRKRGINRILNLGDSIYGPLKPRDTADILESMNAVSVRGNEDRILDPVENTGPVSPTLDFVRTQLSEKQIIRFSHLPLITRVDNDILIMHGTPRSDTEYLLTEIQPQKSRLREESEIRALLADDISPVICCGHDHYPRLLHLSNGSLILNPGSVGLQAYDDNTPFPHIMETGSPDARYAILTREATSYSVEFITLPYDWESAAQCASLHHREDWAQWLRSGRAVIEP